MPMKPRPQIIQLPKIFDPRGNLTFIQNGQQIPFAIRRAYWIYDVPAGEVRHGHAFREATELVVALSGAFDVVTDSGDGEQRVTLNRSFNGMLIPAMTWRALDNFSTNAVALVLSSTFYNEADYIRDRALWEQSLTTAGVTPPQAAADIYKRRDNKPHSLDDCRMIDLTRHRHPNGSLSVVDNSSNLFDIRRVFYLYDVPGDSERGGHSHYQAHEFITAASGAFDVVVTDGTDFRRFTLNRPYKALYIPNGLWRSLDNFSSGSVSLVLTSEPYSELDYCRSYQNFKSLHNEHEHSVS